MAWEGLLRQRNIVFLGEAGCGKSELAVHLALELAGQGREVHFFDLDQTKPLMRSRDVESLLESAGVTRKRPSFWTWAATTPVRN